MPIPIPTPTGQSVAYGASLDEWDEALVAEPVQTEPDKSEEVVDSNQDNADASAPNSSTLGSPFTLSNVIYQEILWDSLVPTDFTADAIMAKYEDQLAEFEDGSPEAYDVYVQMQEEFNNAPINEEIGGTMVRIPGFIAPLDFSDELITEFLLVPYFGACIHVPPPPANQTVLVNTSDEYGIKPEDSYNPVWIMGKLTTEGATTDLAEAGYIIQDAIVEPYDESE